MSLAALIVTGACLVMLSMAAYAIATGDTAARARAQYLEPVAYPVYTSDYEFTVAPVCAPTRALTLTAAYLPADDNELIVGYSDEMIVGWELSEVNRCEN